ncbi:MAG TPA: hypothetical protein VK668_04975 [Mucilaginibacter sp.]|nr:hypothetical protein [Mucilaginibacter sp.]
MKRNIKIQKNSSGSIPSQLKKKENAKSVAQPAKPAKSRLVKKRFL